MQLHGNVFQRVRNFEMIGSPAMRLDMMSGSINILSIRMRTSPGKGDEHDRLLAGMVWSDDEPDGSSEEHPSDSQNEEKVRPYPLAESVAALFQI